MKNKIISVLLIFSLGVNLYMLGKWFLIDRGYEPTPEEQIVLNEMVQKTVESEDFKKLAQKENIIAIESSLDKNKGGAFPYYFGVSVRTDKQTHIFTCANDQCSKLEASESSYSIYKDEKPRLPFGNKK